MANYPQSLSVSDGSFVGGGGGMSSSSSSAREQASKDRNMQSAERLVLNLLNPNLRENALLELFKKRELFPDLAPLLWHSFGIIAVFLQEILSIYPFLSPPNLTSAQSNRVCNVLALLQVDDTKVIKSLLSSEIMPNCLSAMKMGCKLSKTIIQGGSNDEELPAKIAGQH